MNETHSSIASESPSLKDPARWAGIDRLRSECLGLVILQMESLELDGKSIFTPREAERAARMGPPRRKSFTAARAALKMLVRRLDPGKQTFPDRAVETLASDGVKPCLADLGLSCSISHSSGLVAAVAENYLTLAADQEALRLAQATLDTQKTSYDLIRQSRDAGVSSDLVLRQSQSQVEAARVDVARYTGLVAVDKNALNLLVGTAVSADLLPDGLGTVGELKDVSAGLDSEFLLRRPDILAAEQQLWPRRRYPIARLQQRYGPQPLFETAFNYNHFHVYDQLERVEAITIDEPTVLTQVINLVLLLFVGVIFFRVRKPHKAEKAHTRLAAWAKRLLEAARAAPEDLANIRRYQPLRGVTDKVLFRDLLAPGERASRKPDTVLPRRGVDSKRRRARATSRASPRASPRASRASRRRTCAA